MSRGAGRSIVGKLSVSAGPHRCVLRVPRLPKISEPGGPHRAVGPERPSRARRAARGALSRPGRHGGDGEAVTGGRLPAYGTGRGAPAALRGPETTRPPPAGKVGPAPVHRPRAGRRTP